MLINRYKSLPVQIRASLWFLVCAFLQKGISVITTPIFTRILSVEEYGRFSVFNSWYGFAAVIVTLNLSGGLFVQGIVKFEKEQNTFSSALLGLTTTLCAFWTVAYILFQDFWNQLLSLTTVQMLAMLTMVWSSAVFGFWSVMQRSAFKYRALVLITVANSILSPVVGIFAVLNSTDKVTARILGLAVVQLILFVGFFFLQMVKGKKFFSAKYWKYALVFNIPLLPHYLSNTILATGDRIMISEMVDEGAAGIYSLACSISLIMMMFNGALLQTIEPWLYKKIKERNIKSISKVAYPAFLLIAGANLIVIGLAPEIMAFFAPPGYADAIWVIPPVSMSVYFMFTYSFFAVFEFYFEKTKYIAISTVSGALLNISLNFVFISVFGYYAAGYTTLVCYILYAFLHYCFMKKLCREHLADVQPYHTKTVLMISLCFLGAGFLLQFTYYFTTIRYLIMLMVVLVLVVKRKLLFSLIRGIVNVKKA